MRMWMVDPKIMCRQHLLGEHVEIHMLLGCLRRGKNIDGFLKAKLVDPRSMFSRHEELVAEMQHRGYKHNSPLDKNECAKYQHITSAICVFDNQYSLCDRCSVCKQRAEDEKTRALAALVCAVSIKPEIPTCLNL